MHLVINLGLSPKADKCRQHVRLVSGQRVVCLGACRDEVRRHLLCRHNSSAGGY